MRRRILETALANGARQAALLLAAGVLADLPPPSARGHAAQFRANRHPAAAMMRVGLIEDQVKPGEQENN
jgi:hypothetical protein